MHHSEILAKVRARVRTQGVLHTVGYLLFTVLLERLHISLQYVFESASGDAKEGSTEEPSARVVSSYDELDATDLRALTQYGGTAMLGVFKERLARGEHCVVTHVPGGDFAGAAWLKPTEKWYAPARGRSAYRYESCFTLPEHRGRGAFTAAMKFGVGWLESMDSARQPVFVECSVFNTSSERAIVRAGFRRIGYVLVVGSLRRFILARQR